MRNRKDRSSAGRPFPFWYLLYFVYQKKEVGIMIGAILGDMIGAPYEFDRGNKTKESRFFAGNLSLLMIPS